MKTSHQLAKELLSLPDVAVWIFDDGIGHSPNCQYAEGYYSRDGDDQNVVEIYGTTPLLNIEALD